jgi:hypothetical protein
MAIVPVINGNGTNFTVAPSVRRPRRAPVDENGVAISGPFTVELRSDAAGTYRVSPNDIFVFSDRVAITPTNITTPPTAASSVWGTDFHIDTNIGSTRVRVGNLFIKSLDYNDDGLDDLESANSATLTKVFALYGDNMLNENVSALEGRGNGAISAQGPLRNVNPIVGTGWLALSGAGELLLAGFLYGTGNAAITASGTVLNVNPIEGRGNASVWASGTVTPAAAGGDPLASGTWYANHKSNVNWLGSSEDGDNNDSVAAAYISTVEGETIYFKCRFGSDGTWRTFGSLPSNVDNGNILNGSVASEAKVGVYFGVTNSSSGSPATSIGPFSPTGANEGKTFPASGNVTVYAYCTVGVTLDGDEQFDHAHCAMYAGRWTTSANTTRVVIA